LVGGDSERGLLLRDKLASSQYKVRSCQSLRDLCAAINEGKIAVILLLYPDGFAIIEELFANKMMSGLDDKIQVVFISTSSAENNRVRLLHYKADEFLIEPISIEEIVKIIDESIGWRPRSDDGHVLSIGDLTLNRETLIVTWRNKKIPLYPLQVRILELLMLNPGRTIGRGDLLDSFWSTGITVERTTIDRNIKRIRDAFKRNAKINPIRTIRRAGYAFNDQSEQLTPLPRKGRGIS